MALFPCPECQKDVSDKAPACPHCGMPLREAAAPLAVSPGAAATTSHVRRRMLMRIAGGVLVVLIVAGVGVALRQPDYSLVEELRAEQDALGTRNEHVKQRFFRLHREHPKNAMYTYLWARCIDEPGKRLELANEGIREDPRFSWNYNLASRALAQLNRVPEAYEDAVKGAALDPGNMQLSDKRQILKLILDQKLTDEGKPTPNAYAGYESKENFEKAAVRYKGLFRGPLRSPDRGDAHAIEKGRLPDYKDGPPDVVRGFLVCTNPFSDTCVRVYTARDPLSDAGKTKVVWMQPGTDVAALKDNQLVTVAGAVVTTGKGESIVLADAVTVVDGGSAGAAPASAPKPPGEAH
jgi:hypothetical protein